ncbi:MAG: hypothetical protein IPG71_13280 [bacterium]|nr:hypothetical protein [bacterium]
MDKESRATLNILDVFAFLIEWRRIWIPATLVCAISMGVYAFLATPVFRSVATVKGVDSESGSLGSLLASKFGGLGSLGGFGGALSQTRGDYYLLILRGRHMSEKVIAEFRLRNEWNVPDAPIEDLIVRLAGQTYFKYDAATNTVLIQVDHKDPATARAICEYYIKELDARNQEVELAKSRQEVKFAATRLEEARAKLWALEDSMSMFQRATGIFNLEEQAKATFQTVAAVQAQRLLALSMYETKRKFFSADNPEVEMARVTLAGIDAAIARLSGPVEEAERDFLLHLDSASEDGKTYLRLFRDIEISQLLMALLTQQFEQAKLNEARDTPTMVVIEPTSLGSKRVAPKRALLVGLGGIVGLVLSLLYTGLISTIRAHRNTGHPGHESYVRLLRSWEK